MRTRTVSSVRGVTPIPNLLTALQPGAWRDISRLILPDNRRTVPPDASNSLPARILHPPCSNRKRQSVTIGRDSSFACTCEGKAERIPKEGEEKSSFRQSNVALVERFQRTCFTTGPESSSTCRNLRTWRISGHDRSSASGQTPKIESTYAAAGPTTLRVEYSARTLPTTDRRVPARKLTFSCHRRSSVSNVRRNDLRLSDDRPNRVKSSGRYAV